ncbi:MAG: hypothetical protein ABJ079_08090 [Marinomonas sp.]
MEQLDVTRDNKNPNDPQGWLRRKRDAEKGLETALTGLNKINRDFLLEVEELVSLQLSDGYESYECIQRLNGVLEEINFLGWVLQNAAPVPRDIMTEFESRKELARDAFAALQGIGATLSNGWSLGEADPSHVDPTGFEKLAELLEIHQGETPKATSKWLREAMAQDKWAHHQSPV